MPDELNQRDEFDTYSVPKKSRFKIFQFGLAGMSLTASVLLIMLLRCATSSKEEVKEILKEQVKDLKEQAKIESAKQLQQADAKLSPQLDDAAGEIDSLKRVIRQLNKN